ncbi:hypothetical protein GCM10010483_18680 [Actinokineospora diospyrosa]
MSVGAVAARGGGTWTVCGTTLPGATLGSRDGAEAASGGATAVSPDKIKINTSSGANTDLPRRKWTASYDSRSTISRPSEINEPQ